LQNFAPFEIVIGKVSKFPSEKYDVLKFDINGDVLHRMNESLRKLPYTSNHPKYVPHCTIAYVKKYSCEHLLGNRDFDGTQVKIEDITFSTPNDEKTHFKLKNLTETK
jgi:2'-5' RNA ligase